MKVFPRFAIVAIALGLLSACMAPAPTATPLATSGAQAMATAPLIQYVTGSTEKICQVTGETDLEFNKPTASQTETRFGLVATDLGYSFEHNGKLFFLFGDSIPSPRFKGKPNGENDPPRIPDDNDAIAFASDFTVPNCPRLDFITDSIDAYKNPVVLNAQGQPAITLRTDEAPFAGISDGGRMFVIFGTDNYVYPPGPSPDHLGFATRTVIGVSDDDGNTFHYLYDFSKPPCTGCERATDDLQPRQG